MADSIPPNIISALNLISHSTKLRSKTSSVIRKDETETDDKKIKIIGGDSRDFEHNDHPAIVIEKNGDVISKIIVRCPCGRHSELVCEYDETSNEGDMTSNMVNALQATLENTEEAMPEGKRETESQPPPSTDAEAATPESVEENTTTDNHYDEKLAAEMAAKALGGDILG